MAEFCFLCGLKKESVLITSITILLLHNKIYRLLITLFELTILFMIIKLIIELIILFVIIRNHYWN